MTVLKTTRDTPSSSPIDEPSLAVRARWTEQLLVMMRSSDTAESIERACRIAKELLGLDVALVARISGDSQTVIAATTTDVPSTIPVGPQTTRIFDHGGVMMARDIKRLCSETPAVDMLGFRCLVAVPIIVENRPWGLLAVGSPRCRSERFPEMARDLMDALGRTLSHLIERDEARSRLVPIERLRQSNRELERYAYAAAHDLRTPLRAIRNFTELALDAIDLSPDPERPRTLLRRAIDNAQRMDDLLVSMLEHAKAIESTGPIEPVDLNSEVVQVIDTAIADRGCTDAEIEIGPLPVLEIDQGQLRRVLDNIVENAFKYRRPDRRLRLTVSCRSVTVLDSTKHNSTGPESNVLLLSAQPAGTRSAQLPPAERQSTSRSPANSVELRFTDNGRGIPPDKRATAFELFRRHSNDGEGTGVGLAIVRRIVEELDGSVTLADGYDGGLTVCLSFPAALVKGDGGYSRCSSTESPSGSTGRPSTSITVPPECGADPGGRESTPSN